MYEINLRGLTAKGRSNADTLIAAERIGTREQGTYMNQHTAVSLVRRGIAEFLVFEGRNSGAVRATAEWMRFNVDRANLIEWSRAEAMGAALEPVALPVARDLCSRHGLSRYPSCPKCDAAENAIAELKSCRGLGPDQVAYLGASRSKRIDAWNVSSVERRAWFTVAEGRVADDWTEALSWESTRRGGCGRVILATRVAGPDMCTAETPCARCADDAERLDADRTARHNAHSHVRDAESNELCDFGQALIQRCDKLGHEHPAGWPEQLSAAVAQCYLDNFRGLRMVVETDAIWNAPNVVKLPQGATAAELGAFMDALAVAVPCGSCGAIGHHVERTHDIAADMSAALVERCARLGHDHVIEGHPRPRLEAIATATICYARNFAGTRVLVEDDGEWFPGTVDAMMWSGDGMVVRADDQPDSPVRVPFDRIRFAVPVAVTKTGHADYPHEPGTLYDCPACEADCFCGGRDECVRCAVAAEVSS